MAQTINLSRLMRISWAIQKHKRLTRSKALAAAWMIFHCEDITVEFLTQKLNRQKPIPRQALAQFGLFNQ